MPPVAGPALCRSCGAGLVRGAAQSHCQNCGARQLRLRRALPRPGARTVRLAVRLAAETVGRRGAAGLLSVLLALLAVSLAVHEGPFGLGRLWPFAVTALAAMALAPLALRGVADREFRRRLPPVFGVRRRSAEFNCGIVALVLGLPLLAWSVWGFTQQPDSLRGPWFAWIAAALLMLLGFHLLDNRASALVNGLRREVVFRVGWPAVGQWGALLLVLAVATAARVVDLGELPAGLDHDEELHLVRGLRLGNTDTPAQPYEAAVTAPSAYLMMIHRMTELVGISLTAPRLVSVFLGVAGVAAVFLLGRRILGWPLGILAAAVLAGLAWDINYSRLGLPIIATPLCAALSAWATLRALSTGRACDFALAGALAASGFWFYQSYVSFPAVLGAMLVYAAVVSRPPMRRRFVAGALVMGLMGAVFIAPQAAYAVVETEEFLKRGRDTSLFHERPPGESLPMLWDNLLVDLRMFHMQGGRHPMDNLPGAPMLDPVSGALLLLGVALSIARWRRLGLALLLLWVLLAFVPSLVSDRAVYTNPRRTIAALPAVALLVALMPALAWRAVSLSPRWWRLAVRSSLPAAALLAAAFGIGQYFGPQAAHPRFYVEFNTAHTLVARDVAGRLEEGYAVGSGRGFRSNTTAGLLTVWPDPTEVRVPDGVPVAPVSIGDRKGMVVYLFDNEREVFDALTRYYPGAVVDTWRTPRGDHPIFHRVTIGRDDLWSVAGLETGDEGPALLDTGWLTAGAHRGFLHVRMDGEYEFRRPRGTGVAVRLDGRPLFAGEERDRARVELVAGLHPLEILVDEEAEPGAALLWKRPDAEWFLPIAVPHLYHGSVFTAHAEPR